MKVVIALCVVVLGLGNVLEAGIFSRRSARRSNQQSTTRRQPAQSVSSATQVSPQNRPLTRMGQNRADRRYEQDVKIADRKGVDVQEVEAQRIRRLTNFGAVLGAAGAGLSGAADAMNYATPTPATTTRPGNYSGQSQMRSFNRNYSTNPDHAPFINSVP